LIFTIARHELRALFLSPLAWAILAIIQFVLAYVFLIHLQDFLLLQPRLKVMPIPPGVTEYLIARLYAPAAMIYLFVMPLLTMRLVAEELRNHSFALLLSAPVSSTEIVLGKYLGLLALLALMLAITTLMPLSLWALTEIDLAALALAFLGSLLLVSACGAAGLYLSTLTSQPTIAAFSTFGLLFLLWIIGLSGGTAGATGPALTYVALPSHLQSFLLGILDSGDCAYYLLFIATFLTLSVRRLDNMRLQG
jgi:ABC-2 type transport system permease protein